MNYHVQRCTLFGGVELYFFSVCLSLVAFILPSSPLSPLSHLSFFSSPILLPSTPLFLFPSLPSYFLTISLCSFLPVPPPFPVPTPIPPSILFSTPSHKKLLTTTLPCPLLTTHIPSSPPILPLGGGLTFRSIGMVTTKGGKRHAAIAMDALKELFLTTLLPDCKLKFLGQQPVEQLGGDGGQEGKKLVLLWMWEDVLKDRWEGRGGNWV